VPIRSEIVTAVLLTISLRSLTGVPLTGDFFGKFYIFRAALESTAPWWLINTSAFWWSCI
jgi:NADH-quinone oxidoreductase subunit N